MFKLASDFKLFLGVGLIIFWGMEVRNKKSESEALKVSWLFTIPENFDNFFENFKSYKIIVKIKATIEEIWKNFPGVQISNINVQLIYIQSYQLRGPFCHFSDKIFI